MRLTVLFFLTLGFLAGCSDPLEDNEKCPCDVKINELQEDGTYKRSVYTFKTLENARTMTGSKINLRFNPRFYQDGSVKDITPENQFFVNSSGILIPSHTFSEELFSIYKIMEELYYFDTQIGVDRFLTYPRTVSIDNRSKSAKRREDAYYTPIHDRIVVLSYDGKLAPLGLNKGVIAHEHFHAIFNNVVRPIQKTVNDIGPASSSANGSEKAGMIISDTKDKNLSYNYLILRALDEGLSDFWASLITGMSNAYLASLSKANVEYREVSGNIYPIHSQDVLAANLVYENFKTEMKTGHGQVQGYIYFIGVHYSNLIKSLSKKIALAREDLTPDQERVEIAKWIISSLQKLAQTLEQNGSLKVLSQADLLSSFIPETQNRALLKEICADLNEFLLQHSSKISSCSKY